MTSTPAPAPRKTSGTGSSRKVLQLLFSFSEYRGEATVAELAAFIGAPVPTTYRYVALLKELNLLEDGGSGKYHPTAKVMPLARAAQMSNSIAQIAKPIIATAATRLRETVMLMQSFGDDIICVELQECDRPMRYTFQQGHSIPLGTGATGKMILHSLPSPLRENRLAQLGHITGLQQQLDQISEQRYATSLAEIDDGVWACSVPVLTQIPRPVALTMAGPASRISDSAREVVLDVLRQSAELIRAKFDAYRL